MNNYDLIQGKNRTIVAIDTDEYDKAVKLIDSLEGGVEIFKVGLELYLTTRGKILDYLKKLNKRVFLDLKFHDIPNTMKNAVRSVMKDEVWMMTIHVTDFQSMKACADMAREEAQRLNIDKPIIVGVTVLTSMSNEDLESIGCVGDTKSLVLKRAKLAKEAGLDGVVCSAHEASEIKKVCGDDFITVCPGIRPKTAEVGDQKRVMTPAMAIENGANYLVVGRPITKAENPRQAADNINAEIDAYINEIKK